MAAITMAQAVALRLGLDRIEAINADGGASIDSISAELARRKKSVPVFTSRPRSFSAVERIVYDDSVVVVDSASSLYEALRSGWIATSRKEREDRGASPMGEIPSAGWIEINERWRAWRDGLAERGVPLIETCRLEPRMGYSSVERRSVVLDEQARGQYEQGIGASVRLRLDLDAATGRRSLRTISDVTWSLPSGRDVTAGKFGEAYAAYESFAKPFILRSGTDPREPGLLRFHPEEDGDEWKEAKRSAEKVERMQILAEIDLYFEMAWPGRTANNVQARECAWFGLTGKPREAVEALTAEDLRNCLAMVKKNGPERARAEGYAGIAAVAMLGMKGP